MVVGLHTPGTPFVLVAGNATGVEFWQYGPRLKVGVTEVTTDTTSDEPLMEHVPKPDPVTLTMLNVVLALIALVVT